MSEQTKVVLETANTAIAEGDYEGFLSLCTDDTVWTFVGDKVLDGKEAIRQWMATEYVVPPENSVTHMIAEGDLLTVLGKLTLKDKKGRASHYAYCDVWRFRDGKMAELKAFVIQIDLSGANSYAA